MDTVKRLPREAKARPDGAVEFPEWPGAVWVKTKRCAVNQKHLSSSRQLAHAHYGESYGVICMTPEVWEDEACRAHEYAHLMNCDERGWTKGGHNDGWKKAVTELGHPEEAKRYVRSKKRTSCWVVAEEYSKRWILPIDTRDEFDWDEDGKHVVLTHDVRNWLSRWGVPVDTAFSENLYVRKCGRNERPPEPLPGPERVRIQYVFELEVKLPAGSLNPDGTLDSSKAHEAFADYVISVGMGDMEWIGPHLVTKVSDGTEITMIEDED